MLLVAAAGVLAWLVLAGPVLAPGRQLGERDTARLYYPLERSVASALRAGRPPFWDPRIECGTSILGQVTPAALHPFALLYLPLPFGLAFKLEHLLALLLGGWGAALFAHQLGATRWPALLAGIVFGGSGALVSSASGNLPYALGPAAAPLAVAGLLWLLRAPSPGRLLASGFALSLCAYGGDPQSLGIAILAGLVLVLLDPPRLRRAAYALAWVVCALLLSAPVALPAASQLQRSQRRSGITEVERRMFSAPPVRLFGLLVPLAFDGTEPRRGKPGDPYSDFIAGRPAAPFLNSICLGAPALLFAAASFRRKRAGALLGLAAVLVLASMGSAGYVEPVLEAVIPGWGFFRFTEKFLLHASWLLAAAAALGADASLLGERTRTRSLAILAAAVAACALAAFLACLGARGPILEALSRGGHTHDAEIAARFLDPLRTGTALTAGLSACVAGIAMLRMRRATEGAAILAAAAAAASVLVAPPLHTVSADLYEGLSATGRKLLEIAGPSEGRWRAWADANGALPLPDEEAGLNDDEQRLLGLRESLWPQLQAIDGIDGAAVYSSAVDPRYHALLSQAPDAARELLDIAFYVVPPGTAAPASAPRSESGFVILQRPRTARAFVVHKTRREDDVAAAISDLRSMTISDEAIVPGGGPVLSGRPSRASAEPRRPAPDRIEVSVDGDAPGLLVVSEHYDPGWRAQVDEKEVPVHPADLVALGVVVPAGRHEVRLRYVPVGFVPGLLCAAAAILVLAALALRHSPRPYSRIL